MEIKRVAVYLRVATAKQLTESVAIHAQRMSVYNYLEQHQEFDGSKVMEFRDIGYKGSDLNRPSLMNLLSRIKKGEFDTLCVCSLSRLSRDGMAMETLFKKNLSPYGARLISVNDGYDSEVPSQAVLLETRSRLIAGCSKEAGHHGSP